MVTLTVEQRELLREWHTGGDRVATYRGPLFREQDLYVAEIGVVSGR